MPGFEAAVSIPRGGTAVGLLTPRGEWVERSELQTVTADGKPAKLLPSSYNTEIALKLIRAIHISNDRKRDAQVAFDAQPVASTLRRVLPSGEEPVGVRLVKVTAETARCLADKYEPAQMLEAILKGDPDVDLEVTGRKLRHTRRIFVDRNYEIVYHVNLFQVVMNPDGTERERRELQKVPGNVNERIALRWTGRFFNRQEEVDSIGGYRRRNVRSRNLCRSWSKARTCK